jgi:Protein of unknown function (DUF3579)
MDDRMSGHARRETQLCHIADTFRAALQHNTGRARVRPCAHNTVTSPDKPREIFIQGVTLQGRTFRPSDWAERLAGAMSCFRPGGSRAGVGQAIGYSPLCIPTVIGNVKCVVVNEALRDIEPMAWDFVMNFARDNDLQVSEACLVDPPRN